MKAIVDDGSNVAQIISHLWERKKMIVPVFSCFPHIVFKGSLDWRSLKLWTVLQSINPLPDNKF